MIAADGKVSELMAGSVGHFVEADVRRFRYDGFERALAWASDGDA